MMNDNVMKQMNELWNNEEFREELKNTNSQEDVLSLIQHHGIELTSEEFTELGNKGIHLLEEKGYIGENGELGPEMLEMVNGGANWGGAVLCFGLAVGSAYIGYPKGTVLMVICGVACLKS